MQSTNHSISSHFSYRTNLRIVLSKHHVWNLLLDYFLSLYHLDKQLTKRVGTEGSHGKISLKIKHNTLC